LGKDFFYFANSTHFKRNFLEFSKKAIHFHNYRTQITQLINLITVSGDMSLGSKGETNDKDMKSDSSSHEEADPEEEEEDVVYEYVNICEYAEQ